MAAMGPVAREDGADQVLLFVVDILNEEATLLVPNDLVKTIAENSFGATVTGDTVVLPGIMSRKKQIIPSLEGLRGPPPGMPISRVAWTSPIG